MLLEIAIGDAYGAGFEFSSRAKIKRFNDLTAYHAHDMGIPAGKYTDDTQMSIAIAELMVQEVEWTKKNIAQKFVECFKRDVRLGYARRFQSFLESVGDGEEFLRNIKPKSSRNGAAMRSAPLGYVKDISLLLEMAEVQAVITHDTEIGVKSSQAVALAAHFLIYQLGPKEALRDFVSEYSCYRWRSDWTKPVACCGRETVHALLTVLVESSSVHEVLVNSVEFGGDVDTVAALGFGIASLCGHYNQDIPDFLYSDLENGTYGRDYLQGLDNDLKKTFLNNTVNLLL